MSQADKRIQGNVEVWNSYDLGSFYGNWSGGIYSSAPSYEETHTYMQGTEGAMWVNNNSFDSYKLALVGSELNGHSYWRIDGMVKLEANENVKSPSDGSAPNIEDDIIEGIGAVLIEVGNKYESAVITKNGQVVRLPTARAYNTFAKNGKYIDLRSVSNGIKVGGKIITVAGQGAVVVGVYFDSKAYSNGEISGERYTYRLGFAAMSTLAGAEVGGPLGAAIGAGIGIVGWAGEKVWDNVIQPSIEFISIKSSEINNAMSSGSWYPGYGIILP